MSNFTFDDYDPYKVIKNYRRLDEDYDNLSAEVRKLGYAVEELARKLESLTIFVRRTEILQDVADYTAKRPALPPAL